MDVFKNLFNIDFFGFSFYQENLENAIKLIRFVKQHFPNSKIIIGGAFPTLAHSELIKEFHEIDFVVRGDGEKAILKIFDGTYSNSDNGISYRGDNIFFSNKVNRLDNLDFSAPPAYRNNIISKYKLRSTESDIDTNTIPLIWSRGCNYNCSFCAIPINKNSWRCRSNNSIISEIEQYYDPTLENHIFFFDANPLQNAKKFRELILEIREKFDVTFSCAGRVDTILRNKTFISELSNLGCISLELGVESFNNEILRYYSKHITKEMISKAFKILKENGIKVELDFILYNPRVTKKDILADIAELENYGFKEDLSIDALYSYTKLYLGTKLRFDYDKAVGKIDYKYIPQIEEVISDNELKNILPELLVLKKKGVKLYKNTVLVEKIKKSAIYTKTKDVRNVQELLLLNLSYKILFFNAYKSIIRGSTNSLSDYDSNSKKIISRFDLVLKEIS